VPEVHVQVVAPHAPHEGVTHAGGAYLLGHLRLVAERHQVSLLAPDRPGTREEAALAPTWLDVTLAPDLDAAPGGPAWQADRVLRRLRGPAPPPQTLRGLRSAGLVNRSRGADVIELHWPEYAYLALVLRRARVPTPIVVFAHDVDSQTRGRQVHVHGDRVDRLAAAVLGGLDVRQERRALDAADLIVVFKQADVDLLRAIGVQAPVMITDPWLDPASGARPAKDPHEVLFTGAMWRRENEDGIVWFLSKVWPQVLAAAGDAHLTVAGAGPTPALLEHAARAGRVTVTGEVPDLEPYYLRASVFVAPLLGGGGLKFKVPQAMLLGLPVIATSTAAEGVVEVAPPGTFWAVADDAPGMARAVVRALRTPTRASEVGAGAATWAAAHYSFDRSSAQILDRYDDLVRDGRLRRSHVV